MNDSTSLRKGASLAGLACLLLLTVGCASRVSAPVRDGTPPPAAGAPAAEAPRAATHVVRPGETLNAIARQHGVTVRDLVVWNSLANPDQIHVGQELRVGAGEGAAVAQAIPVTPDAPVVTPVVPAGAEPQSVAIRQEPKGGKQPYSDAAWAKANPSPGTEAAPAAESKAGVPAGSEAAKAPSGAGDWLWPVQGKIISGFDDPSGSDGKLKNKGIDIAGTPGTPVVAADSGKVYYAGSGLPGLGKLVIIKHDANFLTVYAHNQQLVVKEGDTVTRGQKIAELGSTDADRPKLHFEVRRQGQPVDPLKYLPAR
jgi:lipoprotein NlpD